MQQNRISSQILISALLLALTTACSDGGGGGGVSGGSAGGDPSDGPQPAKVDIHECLFPKTSLQTLQEYFEHNIKYGYVGCVEQAIRQGADPNEKIRVAGEFNQKETFPIFLALSDASLFFTKTRGSSEDMIKALVEGGAKLDVLNNLNQNVLFHVLSISDISRHPQLLDYLLSIKNIPLNDRNQNQENALHVAINLKQEEIAQKLVRSGIQMNVHGRSIYEYPLLMALQFKMVALVDVMLEKGADLGAIDQKSNGPLHIAITQNLEGTAIKIAEKMKLTQLDHLNESLETALLLGLRQKMATLVPMLLTKGVNVNAASSETTPLHEAARWENLAVYQQMVPRVSNLDATDRHNYSVLMAAAQVGNESIVKDLLDRNARIDLKNSRGQTALHLARTAKITALLLNKGAAVNDLDSSGASPLTYAVSEKNIEKAALLLSHSANSNIEDFSGLSLARRAVSDDWQEGAEALLKYASANQLDAKGNSLLFDAQSPAMMDLLITQFGVDPNQQNSAGETVLARHVQHYLNRRILDLSFIRKLLELGADPNKSLLKAEPLLATIAAFSNQGMALSIPELIKAIDHSSLLQLCLQYKANINATNSKGETALHLADTSEEAAILLQAKPDLNLKNADQRTALQEHELMIIMFGHSLKAKQKELNQAQQFLAEAQAKENNEKEIALRRYNVDTLQAQQILIETNLKNRNRIVELIRAALP